VSVLFCDVRGLQPGQANGSGPASTLGWIGRYHGHVCPSASTTTREFWSITSATNCWAMWGAPAPCRQPCRAGLSRRPSTMLAVLPKLNGRVAGAGAGDHSSGHRHQHGRGPGWERSARSASSSTGPLGNTVNLASRLQGATRYLKTPLVIAGSNPEATRRHLSRSAALCPRPRGQHCRARRYLRNSPRAIPRTGAIFAREFETALTHFENGEFHDAHPQSSATCFAPPSG